VAPSFRAFAKGWEGYLQAEDGELIDGRTAPPVYSSDEEDWRVTSIWPRISLNQI